MLVANREMLPPLPLLPSIEPKESLAVDVLYRRRVEPSLLVWASEAPLSLSAEPLLPRWTLELGPPANPWDVWRTPTERETETVTGSERAGAPEFAEALIDEEMLAVGAQSSSLRRIPAGTLHVALFPSHLIARTELRNALWDRQGVSAQGQLAEHSLPTRRLRGAQRH